jgi:(2Fe-2S) ferredoxin
MQKPQYHLLLCASFRQAGTPQGMCHRKEASVLLQYLQDEVSDRGLDAMLSQTGCLNICEKGPVMVVYPKGDWYGELDEDKIDTILDNLEEGTTAPFAL